MSRPDQHGVNCPVGNDLLRRARHRSAGRSQGFGCRAMDIRYGYELAFWVASDAFGVDIADAACAEKTNFEHGDALKN